MSSFSRFVIAALAVSQVALAQITISNLPQGRGQLAMQAKQAFWDGLKESGELPRTELTTLTGARQVCTNGIVTLDLGNGNEDFPCDNIDFESFISLPDLNITNDCFLDGSCIGPSYPGSTQGSDIWGWLSPEGREITIECVDNGVWFIDGTDPENPIRLGYIKSDRPQYAWGDVKVYNDTVYIVKDGTDTYDTYQNGIQVFDLKQLICASAYTDGIPVEYFPQFVYREHGSAHNILIDNDAGYLYTVGVERFGKCLGGIHVMDIKTDRLRPQFVSCITEDLYTHDAQCLTYDGPDTNYTGKEICFAYNEDTVTIWDVTDKLSPVIISKTSYEGVAYTHQGWITDDMRYILVDDELDEVDGGLNRTHTYVFDVSNLANPVQKPTFIHADDSIDHNLYIWGSIHKRGWGGNAAMGSSAPDLKYAYLSNYAAGLRVLDVTDIETGMNEVGFFDVAPDLDAAVFEGTWSNYMHPSGVVAVSSIDRGLFFLRPNMAYDGAAPTPQVTPVDPSECPTPHPTTSPTIATPAPTGECVNDEGLQYSNGDPAPCFSLYGYCAALEIVRQNCRLTCDSCDEVFTDPPTFPDPTLSPTESETEYICTDVENPGITFDDGTSAECYEIRDFCTKNRVVRDRCPVTCGTCDKVSDVVTLPESPDTDPEESTTVEVVIAVVAIIAATVVVALAVFAAAVQVKSYRLVASIAGSVQ